MASYISKSKFRGLLLMQSC